MAAHLLWLMLAQYSAERKMKFNKHLIVAHSPARITDIASRGRYPMAFTVENSMTWQLFSKIGVCLFFVIIKAHMPRIFLLFFQKSVSLENLARQRRRFIILRTFYFAKLSIVRCRNLFFCITNAENFYFRDWPENVRAVWAQPFLDRLKRIPSNCTGEKNVFYWIKVRGDRRPPEFAIIKHNNAINAKVRVSSTRIIPSQGLLLF